MAIQKFLAPLNGQNYVQTPYVDDIFDPLFNAEVRDYYNSIYGDNLLGRTAGILSGYGQMWENALTGKKGILGPGMGILGTFGRSMDKADDFILGGLTEGVNTVGTVLGGSNEAPANPFRNIFVNDQDYTGTRLLASMGNAMSRLTGNEGIQLNEQDFTSLGDKIAGTGIDLATDPGIMGGQLARLNKATPVGRAGQILSDYDDLMANVAGNMALPGAKAVTGRFLNNIMEHLSSNSPEDLVNNTWTMPDGNTTNLNSGSNIDTSNIQDMVESVTAKYNLNPLDTPSEYAVVENIRNFDKLPEDIVAYQKQLADIETKRTEALKSFNESQEKWRNDATNELFSKFKEGEDTYDPKISKYFTGRDITMAADSDAIATRYLLESGIPMNEIEYFDKSLLKNDPEYLQFVKDNGFELSKKGSSLVWTHSNINIDSVPAQLDLIDTHMSKFLSKYPKGFSNTTFRKLFPEIKITDQKDTFDSLYSLAHGFTKDKHTSMNFKNISEMYDTLKNKFIPAIERNETILQKTAEGRAYIELAQGLKDDVFKNLDYELQYGVDDVLGSIKDRSTIQMINEAFDSSNIKTVGDLKYLANNLKSWELKVNPLLKSTDPVEYKRLQNVLDTYYKPFKVHDTKLTYPKLTNITKDLISEPKNYTDILATFNNRKRSKKFLEFNNAVSELNPTDFTKFVSEPKSLQTLKYDNLLEDTMSQFKSDWNLNYVDNVNLESYVRRLGSPKQQSLYAQVVSANDKFIANKTGTRSGLLEYEPVKKITENSKTLSKKFTSEQVKRYQELSDSKTANIIKKDEMLTWLIEDGKGYVDVPISITSKEGKAHYSYLKDILTRNVNKINSKSGDNILVLIDTKVGGIPHLGYAFNVDNLNVVDKTLKLKNLDTLEDMIFKPGVESVIIPEEFKVLDEHFNSVNNVTSDLSKRLGIQQPDSGWIKHVGANTPEAVKYWENYDASLGLDSGKLQKIIDEFNRRDFIKKGTFGTVNYRRHTLGNIKMYGDNYTNDLNLINTSTFTKGIFDNTNTQTFVDMFMSKNFTIKDNFDSVDTLEKCFRGIDGTKYNGNIRNLELLSPKYNDTGKLVGFKRYNKLNRLDLEKAFADETAILVPDYTVDILDNMCKKEFKANSEIMGFINKYFTTPFKLGTLANPGFIVGNIEDAYFKQAVTMSRKYGTSFADEATNVAMSMREVIALNNAFEESVMVPYREFLTTDIAKQDDIFRKWTSDKVGMTADLLSKNTEARDAFVKYINTNLPEGASRDTARLYLFLNSYQDIGLNKFSKLRQGTTVTVDGIRDLDEVKKALQQNEYSSKSIQNRLMYGKANSQGGFDKFTDQGLINNWYSKAILEGSNDVETLMRSATILNDMKHHGYNMSNIQKALNLDPITEKELYEKFKISMNEAMNTMNTANFNYNKVSGLLNKASYILPFPTFYLKNIGFWMDIIVNKPQIIDNTISVHEGLWSGKSTKDEFTAEAKGRGAIPIGQRNKHLTGIVKQSPYNSMFGAFNAVNNPREDLAYRTNPIARPLTRHLQNPEDVKYRPYSTNQYEKNIKMGDKDFSNLAYMFHQLNPYERFTNTYLRTPGKVAHGQWQLSDLAPSMFQPDFKK